MLASVLLATEQLLGKVPICFSFDVMRFAGKNYILLTEDVVPQSEPTNYKNEKINLL